MPYSRIAERRMRYRMIWRMIRFEKKGNMDENNDGLGMQLECDLGSNSDNRSTDKLNTLCEDDRGGGIDSTLCCNEGVWDKGQCFYLPWSS